MKKVVRLTERDIRRMVNESLRKLNEEGEAEYIDIYGNFADGSNLDPERKKEQEEAAWREYTRQDKLQNDNLFPGCTYTFDPSYTKWMSNDNLEDLVPLRGKYALDAQSDDPFKRLRGQTVRSSTEANVEACKNYIDVNNMREIDPVVDSDSNLVLGGPGESILGDFPSRIMTRNPRNGKYNKMLEESINRAIRKTIKRRLK